jgi:hypothetical protein
MAVSPLAAVYAVAVALQPAAQDSRMITSSSTIRILAELTVVSFRLALRG